MQCNFWWFFESAGPQKRFHTLPALTSIKKYICNIKIKIIFFSTWFSCDFGIDFHRKMMILAVKNTLPCQCVEKGKVFTAKNNEFSMKIFPKITWEMCRKKYKIYFYVTNVFVVTGDRRECLRTFLGPYRLEKPPKIALHFSESITIGISIQTGHLLPRVILASC